MVSSYFKHFFVNIEKVKLFSENHILGVIILFLSLKKQPVIQRFSYVFIPIKSIFSIFTGAPKTWYCVPPKYGHMLEKLAKKIFSGVASLCSNFMRHKTCIISPEILRKHNIPFNKIGKLNLQFEIQSLEIKHPKSPLNLYFF